MSCDVGSNSPAFARYIFECSIATVPPEARRCSLIGFRSAVGFVRSIESAEQIRLGRPLDIVSDDQIQVPVAIEIHPCRACTEFVVSGEARFFRNVREDAIDISEKTALADSGNEQILITVIVIVSDGDTQRVHFNGETGGARDVREGPVAVVAKQVQRGTSGGADRASPCRS